MNLENISRRLNKWFCWLGGGAMVGMTSLACGNIFLRPFGQSWKGTYEIVGFLGAMVFAFSLGYAQMTNSHIAVDILEPFYSTRTKRIVKGIGHFISIIFFGLLAWRVCLLATLILRRGEKSDTLNMIFYPFTYAVAISFGLLTFILFIDFLRVLTSNKEIK